MTKEDTNWFTERLLFVVHRGVISGRYGAIIGQNHCLPIACSHSSHVNERIAPKAPIAEAGFHALWEFTMDVEEFFARLGMDGIEHNGDPTVNGLYVLEVEYDENEIDMEDEEGWGHLYGGDLRRPTLAELEPLTQGRAPWGGVAL